MQTNKPNPVETQPPTTPPFTATDAGRQRETLLPCEPAEELTVRGQLMRMMGLVG